MVESFQIPYMYIGAPRAFVALVPVWHTLQFVWLCLKRRSELPVCVQLSVAIL